MGLFDPSRRERERERERVARAEMARQEREALQAQQAALVAEDQRKLEEVKATMAMVEAEEPEWRV